MHIAFTDMHLMKKFLLKKKILDCSKTMQPIFLKALKWGLKYHKKAYLVLIFLNKFEY